MARKRVNVTFHDADPARIPEELVAAALLLAEIEARGLVEVAGDKLRIRRQGGFVGVDIWLVLTLFYAAGATQGFRTFWKALGPRSERVAGLARRKQLPSPASVSRALNAVEPDLLRDAASWLLTEAPGIDELLRHPSVLSYDAKGDGWHVFDVDPTVRTLRHRALPAGDDLPEPERRSAETGAPGHSGRKRGDVQFRRVDVQHSGSGVFVHAHLHTGNGDGAADLELAAKSIGALVDRLSHPRARTLTRMDGEHGYVPYYAALRALGLPFVTRLNRQKFYEDADILARLRAATWFEVPDSGSGPRRVAADIGIVTLHPDKKTRRPDGGRYEPLAVRVVASAFRTDGPAGRGRMIDGWQVELFAADVPADRWPAPEVVTVYFGRSAQENRFAQEDREVGLDRIVSYHLPGQELATLSGLFLMNYRIARGFELERPSAVRPAPMLRRPKAVQMPASWPRDPLLTKLLVSLDWPALLASRPGWTWDADRAELRCPDGRPLALTTVRPEASSEGRTAVIFRRPAGGCEDCGTRASCLCSSRPRAAKHLELSIPSGIADLLRDRLVRGKTRPAEPLDIGSIEAEAGLHAVLAPRFLPAAARKRFRDVFAEATLRVDVELPAPERPRPRLVAAGDAARQQRRLTWKERVARNALPEAATVSLDVSGSRELRLLLKDPGSREVAVGGGG